MKVAIIGGKLQGTEACYLANAAGIKSILIDKNPFAPASGLCDRFINGDVIKRDSAVIDAMREADFVLPANENDELLEAILSICDEYNLKLAFDPAAYAITKSKIKSDEIFHKNDIPSPRYFPAGKPPYIFKPEGESGSAGVRKLESADACFSMIEECGNSGKYIIQEYMEGPSYSIEVIGVPGNYRTYTVTEIHVDEGYDCCMVTAPVNISDEKKKSFSKIAKKIAGLVNLHGIMDVEVIDDGKELKVLEIDARLPSQTPITVLKSSGVNMLSEIADITLFGEFRSENTADTKEENFAVYEHLRRENGQVIQEGEHSMSDANPLTLRNDFLGSREVISDYMKPGVDFRGIFINWGSTASEVDEWRNTLLHSLKD